ncbi:putative prophage LambdaBa02, DNA replication DnaC domain protein [Bacillus anthracis]|nr:putative prophage LambdaBa02, DNA replication DnaC domain protein [Bacillus anthracis]
MSESIGRVMTRIVNTSACSEETEGYTCEHCNKYIAAITVEVPQLRIKTKYFLHVNVL